MPLYFRNMIHVTFTMLAMVNVMFMEARAQVNDTLKTQSKEDVIVTGQYGENSLTKSVYKVKVIDQKRIQLQGAVNLKDVLGNELNIRVNNDPALGSGLSIQGIGGQNIKIMIDGVPIVGREGNFIDLNQINLNNIERIEVVEGPMSVKFGTDALGGVINLITKKSTQERNSYGANAYYESIGQYNVGANAAIYHGKGWRSELNVSRNFFDGYAPDESSRVMLWKPRTQYFGDYSISKKYEKISIRNTLSVFDEKVTNRDSGIITPYSAYGIDQYYYTRRISNSLAYEHHVFANHRINIIASYNYYSRIINTVRKDLVSLEESMIMSPQMQDTGYFDNVMSRGTLSRNKDKSKFNYQLGYEVNYDRYTGNRISGGEQSIYDVNAFSSLELKHIKRLLIRPGLRIVHNSLYRAPLIPSINIKWDINSTISMRASYGRGFRSPTLKELYLDFTDPSHNIMGNRDLKAETQNNYQLSTVYELKKFERVFRVDVSLFYNEIFNKIDLALLSSSSVAAKYISISDFKNLGSNVGVEYKAPHYALGLGYALTAINNSFYNQTASDKFFYNNEFRSNARYTIRKIKTHVSVFYKFNSRIQSFQYNLNDGSVKTGFINGYGLWDATVNRAFFKERLQLTMGAKNILNVVNVGASMSGGVHSNAGNAATVAMGRTFFCSIQYQFIRQSK